jgi:hypothetical protein
MGIINNVIFLFGISYVTDTPEVVLAVLALMSERYPRGRFDPE